MTARPAPKRSSFGASHPIEHSEEEPPARRRPGPVPSGTIKRKAAIWAEEDVIERIRAAWFHTPTTADDRESSFSDFLLEAALSRAAEREQEYNGGRPFPPVPAGRIGTGRKV